MERSARASGGPDTIVAVASGAGRAAIAVLRLSGPSVASACEALLQGALPPPRRASLRRLRDPATGEILDQCIVIWFPGPATFTGEDQAELHLHGGVAVRAAVLRPLLAQPGVRAAEPGEFTRRAFLNGRLDLTAVEGLADLIDAETEGQRRQALRQLEGGLAERVQGWRDRLVDALSRCEAALDFADEEDVPADVADPASDVIAAVREGIAASLAGAGRGERLREGFTVVIAGPPNAGKSTLLNAIARRDVAIVSAIPGTTRDAIEVRCDLGGMPVTFVDTAGLRESDDEIEREGMARTSAKIASADLLLWLSPAGAALSTPPGLDANTIWRRVTTKIDLSDRAAGSPGFAVSARTGQGLDTLLTAVKSLAEAGTDDGGDAVLTRERHRLALGDVLACLDRAAKAGSSKAVELEAEDLRLALRALGRMTGHVDVDEILDRIFSSFCIGK